jgi:A/G-specific adenine glycosylase
MTSEEIISFQKRILSFYKNHGRDFPWRRTQNPWLILLSEMMLQQTQTGRVEVKWDNFTSLFPAPDKMAAAPLSEVLQEWSGLGYNRRALALKKIAEIIDSRGGAFPSTYDELIAFPMIGPYTAKAILAFAWNRPVVFIETNIRRLFIHSFYPEEKQSVSDSQLLPLIRETLDEKNPRQWYYALMDYGAHLSKKVKNPNRRSAHYVRQSKFEGSDRQKRGALLRVLNQKDQPALDAPQLSEMLGYDQDKIQSLLDALGREGFVSEQNGFYSISP